MYTAIKEIGHLLTIKYLDPNPANKPVKFALQVVLLIVLVNLIFSFDSVLSALAITKVFAALATAILLSELAILVLPDGVTAFLQKNRMYEVFGPVYSPDCGNCTTWKKQSSGSTCDT